LAGFKDIIGQEFLIEHIKNAVLKDKVSHAYIINGEKGMGKKMIAKEFALILMCEDLNNGESCGKCHSCKQILSGNNPDVRYLVREKENNISVGDVRSQIVDDIYIKPYRSKYKLYIIEDSELMNINAQNAILKTMEEPPSYAVILLLTANKNNFLETILSRAVVMDVRLIAIDRIKEYLMDKGISRDRADLSAVFSGGNIGKAEKIAKSDEYQNMIEFITAMLRKIKRLNAQDINASIKEVSMYKNNIEEFNDILLLWFRDILLYKASKNEDILIFEDYRNEIKNEALEYTYEGLMDIITYINSIKTKLHLNVNFEMVMELLFIKIRDNILGNTQ